MEGASEIAPHIWHSHKTGMVMLDITDSLRGISPLEVDGEFLYPKEEYHCTLVSLRREQAGEGHEDEEMASLALFLSQNPISLHEVCDERYLCTKGDERTVIAPVHLVGEDALVAFIRAHFPAYKPFFHVTLLKNDATEHGIRISSAQDLVDRCRLLH